MRLRYGAGSVSVCLYLACVFVLTRIDISGVNLASAGLTTVLYTACRAVLSLYVFGMCFSAGTVLLGVWSRHHRAERPDVLRVAIVCFFVGAATLGLAGTAVGLAGQLKLPVVLPVTVPLVFLAPLHVGPWVLSLLRDGRAVLGRQVGTGRTIFAFLACNLLAMAILAFVWKGLYPASAEADTWDHYIHYYREVLQTGSVGPGEAWGHYWDSKAAGLTHLVRVLSDEFSAQIVAWVLIAVATLVLIDLFRSPLRDHRWGLVGGIVFLSGIMADPSIGAFVRHHAAITAFTGFLVWAAVQILSADDGPERRTIVAAAWLVAFYVGFYFAQIAPLFAGFIGLLLGAAAVIQSLRFAARSFAGLLLAMVAGASTDYVINYLAAGVGSFVSVRLFWSVSDQEKFARVVGDSGLLYFLFADNDNRPIADSWSWFGRVFRSEHFLPLFFWAAAMLLIAGIWRWRISRRHSIPGFHRRDIIVGGVLGAFLLVSMGPPLIFRNDALVRLYLFLNFIVPAVVLLAAKAATDVGGQSPFMRTWVGGGLVILSLMAWSGLGPIQHHLNASVAYAAGRLSTIDALKETADAYSEPERIDFVRSVRAAIGAEPKIFTLTYAPGPGNAFPRGGMITEPFYSLGPAYLDVVFGSPTQAAALLRDRGINYFHLSLEGPLFTGLAFSNLFRAGNLDRHFKLVHRDGPHFLLTWREPGDVEPIPAALTEPLELKQKALLVHPFSREASQELRAAVASILAETPPCKYDEANASPATCGLGAALAGSVDQFLRSRMAPDELLPGNRASAQGILQDVTRALTCALPARLAESRGAAASQRDTASAGTKTMTDRIATDVVSTVQIVFMNECLTRFDRPYCELLTHRDERIPFGVMYRSRTSVSRLLQLDFANADSPLPPNVAQASVPADGVCDEPRLSLSTTSGDPGSSFLISGSGFNRNAQVDLLWGSLEGPTLRRVDADARGAFQNVPAMAPHVPAATYNIFGSSVSGLGRTTFTIQATLEVSPSSAEPGRLLQVKGIGYAPGETVAVLWEASAARLGEAVVDPRGSFQAEVMVPIDAAAGGRAVVARGSSSGVTLSQAITVNWLPAATVTPDRVQPGAEIMVAGSGFTPAAGFLIRWDRPDGPLLASGVADGLGRLPATAARIPSVPPGSYTLYISNDRESTASVTVTVAANEPQR